MTPLISAITRASLHDGNGIRTVTYFKGCSLACRWCHNPETISPKKEVLYYPQKCIGCGRCITVCPEHNKEDTTRHLFLRPKGSCSFCEKSVEVCPNNAIQICGEKISAENLFQELLKDKAYYDCSGGGVTFSGGECLLYPDYLFSVLTLCKEASINTAVETAFHVPWQNIEKVIPYVDTFLIDLKHSDSETHKKLTGNGNELIVDNICKLSNIYKDIWIRVPLIPGINDDEMNLINTAKIISSFGPGIKKAELLPYNNMAAGKYSALGATFYSFGEPQTESEMRKKEEVFQLYLRKDIDLTTFHS